MPRPTKPLLDRATVIAAAVRIIDDEGLAACSLPRLGREFGVTAPSLYHHFADRAEIMAEVARHIVRETVIPSDPEPARWIDWFVELALNFRATILRHPHAAPVLLELVPRDVLTQLYNNASAFLTEAGVPRRLHVMILDGLESFTLGTSLPQAMKPPEEQAHIFASVDEAGNTSLAHAVIENSWKERESLVAAGLRSFLNGAVQIDSEEAGFQTAGRARADSADV